MEQIKWAVNKMPKTADTNLPIMGLEEINLPRELPPVQQNPSHQAGPDGRLPGSEGSLHQGRVLPVRIKRIQGAGRFFRNGTLHR